MAQHLVFYRQAGDPYPGLLTGAFACYRCYETSDGRYLTVAALEPKFFHRLCVLIAHPELAGLQYEVGAQEELAAVLAETFAQRSLAAWLVLFAGEEVAVGPVNTLQEGSTRFGSQEAAESLPALGEHTAAWRAALGL